MDTSPLVIPTNLPTFFLLCFNLRQMPVLQVPLPTIFFPSFLDFSPLPLNTNIRSFLRCVLASRHSLSHLPCVNFTNLLSQCTNTMSAFDTKVLLINLSKHYYLLHITRSYTELLWQTLHLWVGIHKTSYANS